MSITTSRHAAAQQALRTVFGAQPTVALETLLAALHDKRLVRGTFGGGERGCLVFWLSGRAVVNRDSLVDWMTKLGGSSEQFTMAVLTMIRAFDNAGDYVIKGSGYNEFYPPTDERLTDDQILAELRRELSRRSPTPATPAAEPGAAASDCSLSA